MEIIETTADKTARAHRRLLREWITYTVVCSFLTFVNWITTPGHWWVVWVIAGWGLGMALRTLFHVTKLDDRQ